jgi:hypothetical protein
MKRLLAVSGWLLAVGWLLTACQSEGEALDLAYTAVPLTQTRMAMEQPSPTQMPAALEFAVAVERAKATGAAIEATNVWIYGQLTATQVAKEEIRSQQDAAATRAAVEVTKQAFAVHATAAHEAFEANQAATERSFMVTSTAQAMGTATAYPMTIEARSTYGVETERAWKATATLAQAQGRAQATAAYGEAESVNLAIQRERVTNMIRAWLPWMGFGVALALIAFLAYRWSKVRVIGRDAFGTLPAVIIGGQFRDPDREAGKDAATTERAQIGQMVRSLPAGRTVDDLPKLTAGLSAPRIEAVDAEVVQEWVNDVSRQADEKEA